MVKENSTVLKTLRQLRTTQRKTLKDTKKQQDSINKKNCSGSSVGRAKD